MTDISSMTDEQLNEAIFNIKFPNGGLTMKVVDYGEFTMTAEHYSYTHDWRLCGELLEEMQPFTILTKNEFGWQCSSRHGSTSHKETAGRAICEHYLKFVEWKRAQ